MSFGFGTPATTTASAPTFGFTAQTPATGGFGTGAPTFGALGQTPSAQPTAQAATPGLNFGFGSAVAATPQAAPNVTVTLPGGATMTATNNLFGAAAAAPAQPLQSTGLTFGTPAQSKPAGLSFGTPASTGTVGLTGLGGQTTGMTSGGLGTGTLGTGGLGTGGLSAGGLSTGGIGTGAIGTGGLSTGGLGTGTGLGGGLTFGTPATTGGLQFGATTSTTTTGGINFGITSTAGALNFGTTSTASALAPTSSVLSFGATAATTSAPSLFGSATGLFGAKPTTTVTLTTASVPTTINKGLGGLDVSVNNKGLAQGSTSPTAAKENLMPNELMQTIDNFKEFVKTQKVLSSDIARGSARPLNRCSEDTTSLMEMLTTLAGSVQRDRSLADKLKQDTAKALQNAEIAQRTHDTPAGLQYENNAPLLFFMDLAENFEHDLMLFKSQIESTEKHIQTMMTPKTLTPQELTMAMNKLHESLVAVAGRLQGVHSKVQQQKEQYLNFRKYVLKDSTNVFEDIKTNGKSSRSSIGKITSGPTPFGPGNRSFMSSTALNSSQTPGYGTPNPLGWGNNTASSSNLSLSSTMKPPTVGLNFNPPSNLTAPLSTDANSPFQLQKPPAGGKRVKH